MITVILYARKECHLCDQARADLESLKAEIPHTLVEVDVESDPKLFREYGLDIPVVATGPFRLKAPFSLQELRVTLLAASDRERHIEMVEKSPLLDQVYQQTTWTKADSFSKWFSKHYMVLFNLCSCDLLRIGFPGAGFDESKAGTCRRLCCIKLTAWSATSLDFAHFIYLASKLFILGQRPVFQLS